MFCPVVEYDKSWEFREIRVESNTIFTVFTSNVISTQKYLQPVLTKCNFIQISVHQ